MSELREDDLVGRKVLVAENRLGRPNEYQATRTAPELDPSPRADCPFCPGNEQRTPDPTLELCDAAGRWQVRAFANKYPAVDAEAGQGLHEVIVEAPQHVNRTGQVSEELAARALMAYAHRLAEVADDRRFPYRLIFKNVGASAGASLTHLHSQFIALPFVPPAVAGQQRQWAAYREATGSCAWCDRIARERAVDRVVLNPSDACPFVAFCPATARQPFETWILPAEHHAAFETTFPSESDFLPLAVALLKVVRAIEGEIGAAGYNLMLHTAPSPAAAAGEGHWRIEIVPRVASLAGLELATGLFMNVLSPERAAEKLRARIAAGRPIGA